MSEDPSSYVRVEQADGITIVRVDDPRVLSDARDTLYDLAARLAEGAEPRGVVLDLANVHVVQSIMMGVLVTFQKKVREAGGSLKLCAVDPYVQNAFKLARLDQMLEICETEREAVDALRGQGRSPWLAKLFGSK
jgi:anti-anti-sigma factor